jgi:hypothetical protein
VPLPRFAMRAIDFRAARNYIEDMTTTNRTIARLRSTDALRTARAQLRAWLSTEMGRSMSDREVIREANAQLRNAGWRV